MSHSVHHTMLWIVSYVMVLPSEPQKPANNRYSFLQHIQFCLPCRFPSSVITHPFVLDTPLYHSIKLYIPRQRMCLCSRRSSKICQSKNHWANGPSSSSSFSWSVSSSRSLPSLTPPWTAQQLYHTLQQNLLHFDWWAHQKYLVSRNYSFLQALFKGPKLKKVHFVYNVLQITKLSTK